MAWTTAHGGRKALAQPRLIPETFKGRRVLRARAQGAGPAPLMYGNTRASRAKVDKRYAAKPCFV